MKKLSRIIEQMFVTIAFAEAGEFDTARDFKAEGGKDRKKHCGNRLSNRCPGAVRERLV